MTVPTISNRFRRFTYGVYSRGVLVAGTKYVDEVDTLPNRYNAVCREAINFVSTHMTHLLVRGPSLVMRDNPISPRLWP